MPQNDSTVELLTGKDEAGKRSKWPARLDYLQSITGAFLALFITFHIIFESSILFGKDAMYKLTKMFEGEPFIEGGEPLIITALAFVIFSMFIFHAFLAMRKFPSSYKEYQRYRAHRKLLKHDDTNLWFIQITTGFAMFFLGSIHLYMMMTSPENRTIRLSRQNILRLDVAYVSSSAYFSSFTCLDRCLQTYYKMGSI